MSQDLTALTPGVWAIDPGHTVVGFVGRHLMVSKVRGQFNDIEGSITIAPTPIESNVSVRIGLSSLNTGDEKRDEHLKSPDFFDVANNPDMTFKSTKIEPKGSNWILSGDLTIGKVTKNIDLDLEFNGVANDPWGGTRAGFSAAAEISRKDWDLTWNVALEAGGLLVSDNIKIEIEAEAIKQG